LDLGDIVKIGKICLRVRELHNPSERYQLEPPKKNILVVSNKIPYRVDTLNAQATKSVESTGARNLVTEEKRNDDPSGLGYEETALDYACRYCLREDDTPKEPLISPCLCDGSMKFVHLGCLKE
jgi:hypothetical protein